jgi:hypothetical protein
MAIEEAAEKLAKCAASYSAASRNQVGIGVPERATASAVAASRTVVVASEASASVASAASVAFVACEELDGAAPGALATVVAPWWAMRDRISSLSLVVVEWRKQRLGMA